MKFLRGFGKNYFSFAAMAVYSGAKKLHDFEFLVKNSVKPFLLHEKEEDESPPDLSLESENSFFAFNPKPCHCNRFFTLRALLAVHLFVFIPRCPYYNKYFAYRRTGSHPPQKLL